MHVLYVVYIHMYSNLCNISEACGFFFFCENVCNDVSNILMLVYGDPACEGFGLVDLCNKSSRRVVIVMVR